LDYLGEALSGFAIHTPELPHSTTVTKNATTLPTTTPRQQPHNNSRVLAVIAAAEHGALNQMRDAVVVAVVPTKDALDVLVFPVTAIPRTGPSSALLAVGAMLRII